MDTDKNLNYHNQHVRKTRQFFATPNYFFKENLPELQTQDSGMVTYLLALNLLHERSKMLT